MNEKSGNPLLDKVHHWRAECQKSRFLTENYWHALRKLIEASHKLEKSGSCPHERCEETERGETCADCGTLLFEPDKHKK